MRTSGRKLMADQAFMEWVKTCANCKWWGDPYDVALRNGFVKLGHCEPRTLPDSRLWKGLTSGDYTCGEWREKTDDG